MLIAGMPERRCSLLQGAAIGKREEREAAEDVQTMTAR
jgi:hypothetical protein